MTLILPYVRKWQFECWNHARALYINLILFIYQVSKQNCAK